MGGSGATTGATGTSTTFCLTKDMYTEPNTANDPWTIKTAHIHTYICVQHDYFYICILQNITITSYTLEEMSETDSDNEQVVIPVRIIRHRGRRFIRFMNIRNEMEERLFEEDTAQALRESLQTYTPAVKTTTRKKIDQYFPEYKARQQREKCPVCLEELKRGVMMRELPCHHYLHSECLVGWFTKGNTVCPMCRYEVNLT